MKQCKSHRRYKGVKIPKCDGGRGCDACWETYFAKNGKFSFMLKWLIQQTPEERRESLRQAGIIDADGKLAEKYRR